MAEPRLDIEQKKKEPLGAASASVGEQKHDPKQDIADMNEGQDTNKKEAAVKHQVKKNKKKKNQVLS